MSHRRGLAVALISAVVAGAFTVATPLAASAAVQATFYASPNGSGTDCTSAAPCSLTGARAKVRAENDSMTGDIEVVLADGTYQLDSTFALEEDGTTQDSGSNGFDVVYRAATGAHPVLSGGLDVSEGQTVGGATVDWQQVGSTGIYRAYVGSDDPVLQMYVDDVPGQITTGEALPAAFTFVNRPLKIDGVRVTNGGGTSLVGDDALTYGYDYAGFPSGWSGTNNPYPANWGESNGIASSVGNNGDDVHWTTQRGSYAEYTFTGTGVEVLAEVDAGNSDGVNVFLDGSLVSTVSTAQSPRAGGQVIYGATGLAATQHTIRVVHEPVADIVVSNTNYPLSSWANVDQVLLEFYSSHAWQRAYCGIDSVSGNNITMKQPCWNQARRVSGYNVNRVLYVKNAYELLKDPGQFYYNVSDKYLYYKPRSFENLETATVQIPRLERILVAQGGTGTPLHDVRIEGIGFKYSRWNQPISDYGFGGIQGNIGWYPIDVFQEQAEEIGGGVVLHNAKDMVIRRNAFANMGGTGLVLEAASQQNLVEGNSFMGMAGGGIHVGDVTDPGASSDANRTIDNIVKSNYISTVGRDYPQAVGIFGGFTKNLDVLHNEVTNTHYSGISVGWGWGDTTNWSPYSRGNDISYNRVVNVMQSLNDGGAIYTNGIQPDSTMSYNYTKGNFNEFGALYLDTGTSNFDVHHNAVANFTTKWLMVQNFPIVASGNTVSDNWTENPAVHGNAGANGNTLTGTELVVNGAWPASAAAVITESGLEDAFADIKTAAGVLVDDTDRGITYSGTWTASGANRRQSDFGQSAHYTHSPNSFVEYTFSGPSIEVIAETAPGLSNDSSVYIDGVLQTAALNQLSTVPRTQQTVYRVDGLSGGPHTIKIVNNTTDALLIDAFEVTPTPVTGLTVDPSTAAVLTGFNVDLNDAASISPSSATNRQLFWSSSNEAVATVGDGIVTGVAPGTATITAKTMDGAYTDTVTVTVSNPTTLFFDDFADNTLSASWRLIGGTWSESGGRLAQTSTGIQNTRMALPVDSRASFDADQTAMITAKVKVDSWTAGDTARAGVSLFTGSDGLGYNLLFHSNQSTVQFLDDGVAWGPAYPFTWTSGTWYWFKLKMDKGTLYGKVWADGSAEPGTWPYSWKREGRSGYPGLNSGATSVTAGSSTASFDDVTISGPPTPAVTGIELDKQEVVTSGGTDLGWDVDVSPVNAYQPLTWSSSNTAAATVSNGVVTKVAPGTTDITVDSGSHADSARVYVVANDTDSAVTYSGTWYHETNRTIGGVTDVDGDMHHSFSPGSYVEYSFTGTGVGVLGETFTNGATSVRVYIDGVLVDTIDQYSTERKLREHFYGKTGLSSGAHTIKLVNNAGGDLVVDAFTGLVPLTDIDTSSPSASMTAVSTLDLAGALSFTPSLATDQRVTWTTSDSSVASVSSNGIVTGLAAGSAVITATSADGAHTAQTTVTVSSPANVAYTDLFEDGSVGSAWSTYGGTWTEASGVISQTSSANGSPKQAIVSNASVPNASSTNLQVTAKVKVDSWTDGDYARAGVGLFTGTGNGQGYNLLFHGNHSTVQFLDDGVAWGPAYSFTWTNGTWYWFKLKSEGGVLYGKVWKDGSPEPSTWPYSWSRAGRTGYPSLNGGATAPGAGGSSTVTFDRLMVNIL